ncbi:MAG: UDP-N-acetylglucosamine--N-acetylmuramyl-(pentapeptide) pyrophosphoryl-undecaprenol N-acetylglucosamine transferase [Spartobacteria bacterium]|nr:UDP-N-acetylglucosamine--N-acetylmuramyl-(pentapeptide) pyrophosphoryl-undecaprenol N-acetylglucosamine transferase [Spartobacteria bacterium]
MKTESMLHDVPLRIAVACGGTGGHIYPGLATAEELTRRGHDVTLWLAGKDVESTATRSWKGKTACVHAEGLPSSLSMASLKKGFSLLRCIGTCYQRMRKDKPQVVLAMGSYASVGPSGAARLLRIPLVLHEANVLPGRTISLLSRHATAVAVHFPEAEQHLSGKKIVYTGMPLRAKLQSQATPAPHPDLDRDVFTFLVMGGSRGARKMNALLSEAFCRLKEAGQTFQVVHLTGTDDESVMSAKYTAAGIRHVTKAYEHDMRPIYYSCDFAICRSGASSCAELAIWGIPALFVPYPFATGDHQWLNACALKERGMADVIREGDITDDWLDTYLQSLLSDTERIATMSSAAKKSADVAGVAKLADLVQNIASGTSC